MPILFNESAIGLINQLVNTHLAIAQYFYFWACPCALAFRWI